MLGLKYVVAKSKELQVKLEQRAAGSTHSSDTAAPPSSRFSAQSSTREPPTAASEQPRSRRSVSSPTASGRNEGEQFLALQHAQWTKVHTQHEKLLVSGEQLSDALALARKKLQDQAESEQFIQQHFHTIARVREQIARMRDLVTKIADDAEDVEQFLVQKTEEYMAAQNASFAARQQEELERFEDRILGEKEDRKRQLREARREQLARAFQNDLKTYQTLVTYQGEALPRTVVLETSYTPETLESIDLIVTADAEQLDAFYESASSDEDDGEESKRDGAAGERLGAAEVANESKESGDVPHDAVSGADQEDDEVAV